MTLDALTLDPSLQARWLQARAPRQADAAILLRQALLAHPWHPGEVQRAAVETLYVPAAPLLDAYGLRCTPYTERYAWIEALPWQPSWLDDPSPAVPLDRLAAQRQLLRGFTSVPGDPILKATRYDAYRCEAQRDAYRAVTTMPPGGTLLAVLPTGAGKSLLAVGSPPGSTGLTVVVVPTVALALDQAQGLGRPDAVAYQSGDDAALIAARIAEGAVRILFTSPEALFGSLYWPLSKLADQGLLARLVIDEAHIVDAWGDAFRPDFQRLAGWRRALLSASPVPFQTLLLSGTVTQATHDSLRSLFGDPGPFRTVASVQLRPEIALSWAAAPDVPTRVARVLEAVQHLPRPLILYTATREDAHAWHERLKGLGHRRLELFTGDTSSRRREKIIAAWRDRSIDLIVATSAFGMGVDQQDVRAVVHACLPESLDRYYQEVGRAGRDGRSAVGLLVHAPEDKRVARSLARRIFIKRERGLARWNAMFSDHRTPAGAPAGVIAVPLAKSDHVDRSSRVNTKWNLRTLTLMQRAGLINLLGPWREADTPPGPWERVALLHSHHADADYWDAQVLPVRKQRMEEATKQWREMRRLLARSSCASKALARVYTLSSQPPVARSCAGCKACRRKGQAPFAGLMPCVRWPWDTPSPLLGEPFVARTWVTYPVPVSSRVRITLGRVADELERRGAQMLVASPEARAVLGHQLPFSETTFTPFALPDVPSLFVYAPDEPVPETTLYVSPPHVAVCFIPEHVPAPGEPERQFADLHPTISLDLFRHRLRL